MKCQNLNKSRRQREFGDGQHEPHTALPASHSPSDDEDVILSSLRSASANGQSISLSVQLLTHFGVPLGRPTLSLPQPILLLNSLGVSLSFAGQGENLCHSSAAMQPCHAEWLEPNLRNQTCHGHCESGKEAQPSECRCMATESSDKNPPPEGNTVQKAKVPSSHLHVWCYSTMSF